MADIIQFSKNIRKRGRQVENSASELVRKMAKRALKALVLSTKVDKGVARSNWRVGVGAAPTAVIEPYARYPKGSKANGQGASETQNANAAIAAGFAKIDTAVGVSGVGLKKSVIITNNTPYIDKALFPGAVESATAESRAVIRGFKIFSRNSGDDD